MNVGMETYNPDGTLRLSMTSSFCRFFGYVYVSGSNGSVNISAFSEGTPFFIVSPASVKGSPPGSWTIYHMPTVTVNGATLNWTYAYGGSTNYYHVSAPCYIYYGVY